MDFIPPIIASVLQSPEVQRRQADAKSAQVRRAQALRRNIAAEGDRNSHTVESPEEIKPVHDERDEARKRRKRGQKHASDLDEPDEDDPPHLDLKA